MHITAEYVTGRDGLEAQRPSAAGLRKSPERNLRAIPARVARFAVAGLRQTIASGRLPNQTCRTPRSPRPHLGHLGSRR